MAELPCAQASAVADVIARALAGAALPAGAQAAEPMPVRDLAGRLDHWFVPVTAGPQQQRLVAFVRVTLACEVHGISGIGAPPGHGRHAPLVAEWLDTARVRERAAALAAQGETVGEPMLSFDGAPDRLAWAVPLQSAPGRRWAFVAGAAAWLGPGGG